MRYGFMVVGLVAVAVCTWFLYAGFGMEVTVPSSDATTYPNGVANLQAMHIQLTDIVIGVVSGLGACVLFVGGAIVAAIEDAAALARGH